MKKELYFAIFVTGMAAGIVAACCCVKKKYERIAQEEIDSVKEVFSKKEEEDQEYHRKLAEQAKKKADVAEYASILQRAGYADMSEKKDAPYVITPDEFGEIDEYEKIELIYYGDGVLADDNNEVVDDVEDMVGDALDHFGEYEDDSVFIRCDERKCDYEILMDQRAFSEVADNNCLIPHLIDI